MIRIYVSSDEEREQLVRESKYVHDHRKIDTDKCNTLAHLYYCANEIIIVDKELHGL